VNEKHKTVDFGAPEVFGAHVFRVEIPASKTEDVHIVEDYGYEGGAKGLPYEEERVVLPRSAWSAIAETARKDFNTRLKAQKISTGRWKTDKNLLDRLLGKELCVLAWAAERAEDYEIAVICSRWVALRPEERWWLFSMTVAEAGLPDDMDRGWRKALYYALSDGNEEQQPKPRKRHHDNEASLVQMKFFASGRKAQV
jgi:23S rRNA G2069 N7-methylase RlmK/C1962 C5-methylase RlmI